jgi:hypothetical protein
MTCREAQKRLVDLFDTAEPQYQAPELRAHLAACANCAREYAEIQAAVALIQPPVRVQASPDFKERLMTKINETETPAKRRPIFLPRLAVAGAVALLLILLAPFAASIFSKRGQAPAPVLSLLAQSAQAMSNLQSIHVVARMRTLPQDNFEYIDIDRDWVPLDIWKESGNPPRWRVEKPGRVVVMDGTSSLLFIKTANSVARGGPKPGFLDWLNLLLDPDRVMDNELHMAQSGDSTAAVTEEDRNGTRQLVLTVERKARGFFTSDWLRDSSVSNSDNTRTYRFDALSKRLLGMQIILHSRRGDVPVFEITDIRYNEPLDPALFSLVLPPEVTYYVEPEKMPAGTGPLPQTPKEAARVLFDALAREDWQQALTVYPKSGFSPRMKSTYGGLQVISLGEPFKSGLFRAWFVPYEIRLKSGYVKKHNLAVRNDNPAHRWVQDGGL